MTALRVVTVVGNPRPESRTHALARTLASELAALAPDGSTSEVDVHLAPLLYELGARIPARGLFVLESELEGFPRHAADWAAANRGALIPASLPAPAG